MRRRYYIVLFLILTLAILTRVFLSSTPDLAQPIDPVPTVPAPSLTADQLKNAQYQLGARDGHAVVQLTDGQYQQGTDATTLDFAHVSLSEFISIGDLTGDGISEAAAIFFENYGGTGNFGFLAIYTNINGLPVFLTSAIIDDRPLINNMTIENGEVYLDAIIHGFEDPGCCPALPTIRSYALVKSKLRITSYVTSTSDGTKRDIEIMSPADGTEVTEFVQISGAVSIAPFENNLSYFIYDEAGNQLVAGSVMVTAPDFGAPGTFSELIPLAGISAGTPFYLEIQDISAADGSWLAMDSVKLFAK
jgi:hypothetical protein